MFANTLSHQWTETTPSVATLDLIVFEVDQVSFGIPINKTARIISSVFLGEDYSLTQSVNILDLHSHLTGQSIVSPTSIVLWSDDNQQLVAIPIETVPVMLSLSLDRIRTLPSDFRTNNPLGIASHIAMLDDLHPESMLFILGDRSFICL